MSTHETPEQRIARLQAELAAALAAQKSEPPAQTQASGPGAIGEATGDVNQQFGDRVYGPKVLGDQLVQLFFGSHPGAPAAELLGRYLQAWADDNRLLRFGTLTGQARGGDGSERIPALELAEIFADLTTDGPPLVVETQRATVASIRKHIEGLGADEVPPLDVRLARLLSAEKQNRGKRRREADLPLEMAAGRGLHELPDETTVTAELIRPELALEAIAREPRLVLLGAPGGGKSTALRYLALLLAECGLDPTRPPPLGWQTTPVPIFCPLGPIAGALEGVQAGQELPVLWDALRKLLDGGSRTGLGTHLEAALGRGGAILLFDGLDELPATPGPQGLSPRARVSQAVQALARELPLDTHLVVTCRVLPYESRADSSSAPASDEWRLPDNWAVRRVQPLAFGQVRQFVTGWYRAAYRAVPPPTPDEGPRRTARLLEQIVQNERLRDLIETPLLLTMVVVLHYNKTTGELPRDRALLYDEFVSLLLDRWEPLRTRERRVPGLLERLDIADRTTTRDLRRVLHRVALEAHASPVGDDGRALISRATLDGHLGAFLRGLGCDQIDERLLKFRLALNDQLGLLHDLGDDLFAFPHKTFQEFLAACALADSGELRAEAYHHWSGHDGDRWREALLLLAGRLHYDGKIEQQSLGWLRTLLDPRPPDPPRRLQKLAVTRPAQKSLEQRGRDALLAADSLAEWHDLGALACFDDDELALWSGKIAASLAPLLQAAGEASPLAPLAERLAAGHHLGQLGDPRPGVCGLEPDWCPVPAGPFLHGSSDDDPLASDDEKPQRGLALPGFRIAKHPVTNAQWQRFVNAGGYRDQSYWSASGWAYIEPGGKRYQGEPERISQPRFWDDPQYARFNGPNQPVVGVSWYEATAYCAWLSSRLGYVVRLPSEAEWEKAARGSDGRIYPWDDEWDAAKANTDEGGVGATTAVGCYPDGASPSGALDMAGNVWEWTATPWHATLEKSTVVELSTGESFVIRGGAWDGDHQNARCAYRNNYYPDLRINYLGLRVASALALTE